MTTGKISHSPDYKSRSQVKRVAAQQGNTLTRTDELIKEINERQRLEREVIEAAKKWATDVLDGDGRVNLYAAVTALLEFERKQK